MRSIHWAMLLGSTVLLTGACKNGKGGTGGGGGGAWLVGEDGLMVNIGDDGKLGDGYDLGSGVGDLNSITCWGAATAYVVGSGGTFLRTFDGGETWETVDLGTSAELVDVASGAGTVFVAGAGFVAQSHDDGGTWSSLPGDGTAVWQSIATDHGATAALLLRLDGSIWRYDAATGALLEMTTVPGARSLSMSHDGAHAVVVGDGGVMSRSDDGGQSWTSVATGVDVDLHAAWATSTDTLLAVGDGGTVVRVTGADVEASAPGLAPLRAVHVDGFGRGVAAGEGGEVLLTSDAGATWDVADVEVAGTVLGLDSVNGDGHL